MTTIQPSSTRRIHSILPIALASVLLLGAARLVFDDLKNDDIFTWQFWSLRGSEPRKSSIGDGAAEEDDNVSRPLYTEESCPYLVKQVTCQRNGRPDDYYQFWRWQPNDCNLPRFNASKLLGILRNKRMMFVGDSIQRTQFDSMVCLLQSSIPDGKKALHKVPSKKIFYAQEYNATVEFYWAPFIVELNSDYSTNHTVLKRLVKLDSIVDHSKHWEGVDVLVFESYIWWMHKPIINATSSAPSNIREYNVPTAYKIALQTWAKWLESSINSQKQNVLFVSLSPTHLWSQEWNPGEGNCFGESYPIKEPYWGVGTSIDMLNIVRETLGGLKTDVTLLNITHLLDLRKDAHTSVYIERKGKLLTKEQKADPKTFADYIHWCLPGVPDTWNEILYAYLIQDGGIDLSRVSYAEFICYCT
ncbi:hypothetical protein Drorol1_Dr00027319 [Drosera rotundifolia]